MLVCPLTIKSQSNLDDSEKPVIFVANHASYLDTLVLLAVLNTHVTLVGKKELMHVPFLRSFMRKLGHITVDRKNFKKSKKASVKMKHRLKAGDSILLFPEGTFTYAAGVRPFKLGAFILATQTELPVIPISLKGTRNILRNNQLPKPGRISVTFLPPLKPLSDDWEEANRLRHLARRKITEHSGEHALDLINVAIPTLEDT